MLNFNVLIFIFMLTLGVFMSLSSNNWISIWVGVELSMMSFLPLMKFDTKLNSESCLKYFIFQSLSSTLMMMGVIMISLNLNFYFLILTSLLMKLGAIPFHNWMLSIIDGIDYFSMIVLFSFLKLVPLNLISYMNFDIQLIVMLNLLMSSISSLNKNSLKKILCYSSIYNISLILSCINEYSLWISYMFIYILSSLFMIYVIMNFNFKFINQVIVNNFNFFSKFSIFILILSMGGMPPLFMFMGKIMILENLMLKSNFLMIFIIIITSLLSMFFYIRVSIISMTFFNLSIKWTMFLNYNSMIFLNLIMISMSPVLLILKSLI